MICLILRSQKLQTTYCYPAKNIYHAIEIKVFDRLSTTCKQGAKNVSGVHGPSLFMKTTDHCPLYHGAGRIEAVRDDKNEVIQKVETRKSKEKRQKRREDWWRKPESNRPPYACEAYALPAELFPHIRTVILHRHLPVERATGIEPASVAWEAAVLPLNYARAPACKAAVKSRGKII